MSEQRIRIFSAKACAAPIEAAAERFREETGIAVDLLVCRRHCHTPYAGEAEEADVVGTPHFLTEVAEIAGLDLVVAGASYLADDGEIMGIFDRSARLCLGYRRSALLVQPGNPKGIRALADLERADVTVSVSVIDCLKGAYEDIICATHRSELIRPQIKLWANGCVALVESVAQGRVDVGSAGGGRHEPDDGGPGARGCGGRLVGVRTSCLRACPDNRAQRP